MMLIAIRLDAGQDQTGMERKVTVLIDHMGQRHDTRMDWPKPDEPGIHWGPIFQVTPQEWLAECQIATGSA
jgi:hypothetical protein